MKVKLTKVPFSIAQIISDLIDENGEIDTEEFNQRLIDNDITMWLVSINFGELEYHSSEEATIELKQRYSEKVYEPAKVCETSSDTTHCKRDEQQYDTPVGLYEWLESISYNKQ